MGAIAEPKLAVEPKVRPASKPLPKGVVPRPDPRRRILDAAAQCFTRLGFHGASMQEICAAAEMSPGALYRYFPSKEAIIIAIVEEERAARASLLSHLETAPSFIAGMIAMGQAHFSSEVPMLCAELGPEISAEAARNPVLKAKFDEVEAEMNDAFRAGIEAGKARGEIDPKIDTDLALLMINIIGDGVMLRSQMSPELPLGTLMPALGELIGRMLAPPLSNSTDMTP
jgi:AcrR family transcriptional regulator